MLNSDSSVEGMPKLVTVKLGGLSSIGPNGIVNLSTLAPAIQFLELNNLEKLTEQSLDQMLKNLT